jgi:hypothetical protein
MEYQVISTAGVLSGPSQPCAPTVAPVPRPGYGYKPKRNEQCFGFEKRLNYLTVTPLILFVVQVSWDAEC